MGPFNYLEFISQTCNEDTLLAYAQLGKAANVEIARLETNGRNLEVEHDVGAAVQLIAVVLLLALYHERSAQSNLGV